MIKRGILLVALALGVTACGPRVILFESGPRGDLLTQADLSRYATVGEAVAALRSSWLVQRSPYAPGLTQRAPVWVYRDGTRVGEPDVLRLLSVAEVDFVEHVSPRAATYRWGTGHENGVIHVTSR
jgi:hypothetical protein